MNTEFFDHQVNGFAGVDFQQDSLGIEELRRAVRALHAHHTTGILLTLITDKIEALEKRFSHIEELCREDEQIAGTVRGYHLEGPYLSPLPGYHGAHPPECMKAPDLREFERLQAAAGGRIRLVTLAPELPGSAGFIRELHDRGVRTSIGHSDASDAQINEAVAAGLSLCTHLGNGVPVEMHRHNNITQRLLARDELIAAFIPDGIHLPGPVLRNFVRAKPADKVIFTTDCMAAAGAPPGRYKIGRHEIECGPDGVVRQPGKNNFAGSSLTMDEAHRRVMQYTGWSEQQSAHACGAGVAALF